ncbi:MAG: PLP-dependent aminotransferase family protein [Gemmatimonadaceae bacterium]
MDRRDGPLYLAIADALGDDVARGRLRAGDRVPTHRALAAELGIDFTTVSRAYAEARRRGLVIGQTGRGTFVREAAAERARPAPQPLVDLSVNVPAEPRDNRTAHEIGRLLNSLAADSDLGLFLQYDENNATPDHGEAGAIWIAERELQPRPECIAICAGAQHAAAVVLGTLGAAGRVTLAEGLSFPTLRTLAHYLDTRLVGVALDDDGLCPDAFAKACRAHKPVALYTVPTLQNPTASIMSANRRREIAEIARKYGVAIIEDDVYGVLPSGVPAPLSAFAPELSYYVASLSKCVAPALRIAYVLAPDERAAARLGDTVRATVWMVSPLLSEIAARAIRDGTAKRIVQARRKEAAARHRVASQALGHLLTRANRYGCHAWIALPDAWPTAQFVAEARRRGVAVSPSDVFALDPDFADPGVRLCLGAPPSAAALAPGMRVLAELLEEHPNRSIGLL